MSRPIQPQRENDGLPRVEHRQRYVSTHAQALVTRHRLVISRRLALFGAEILHGLEIQQAVDRLGVGVAVALVHRTSDRNAPVGGDRGVDEIRQDGNQNDRNVSPVERVEQSCYDEREFDQRRNGGEHRRSNNGFDRVTSTLENPGQSAGLALEMKAQRKLVQVNENFDRQSSHAIHRDRCEQGVPSLLRQRHADAQQTIADSQGHDRSQEREGVERLRQILGRQGVGDPFEHIGGRDREQLRSDHEDDREQYAEPQVRTVRRPYVRQ